MYSTDIQYLEIEVNKVLVAQAVANLCRMFEDHEGALVDVCLLAYGELTDDVSDRTIGRD